MDSTLSTIAPVRTNEGALPNGRVIFHYNPDVRYGEGIPGLSEEDAPPLRSDDAGDPELKGRRATEDTDDDGDGYLDVDEIYCSSDPLDSSSIPVDTDGDLLLDCVDTDDDNDGKEDNRDAFPLDTTENRHEG